MEEDKFNENEHYTNEKLENDYKKEFNVLTYYLNLYKEEKKKTKKLKEEKRNLEKQLSLLQEKLYEKDLLYLCIENKDEKMIEFSKLLLNYSKNENTEVEANPLEKIEDDFCIKEKNEMEIKSTENETEIMKSLEIEIMKSTEIMKSIGKGLNKINEAINEKEEIKDEMLLLLNEKISNFRCFNDFAYVLLFYLLIVFYNIFANGTKWIII